MAYSVILDIQNRFPTAAAELAGVVAGYIIISDAEIDAMLRGARYVTPIAVTVPDFIRELSILKTGVKLLDILYERQNSQVDGDYIEDLKRIIGDMETGVKMGTILPKIPMITMSPVSSGDNLSTPSISQHAVEDGFPLKTEDSNPA